MVQLKQKVFKSTPMGLLHPSSNIQLSRNITWINDIQLISGKSNCGGASCIYYCRPMQNFQTDLGDEDIWLISFKYERSQKYKELHSFLQLINTQYTHRDSTNNRCNKYGGILFNIFILKYFIRILLSKTQPLTERYICNTREQLHSCILFLGT